MLKRSGIKTRSVTEKLEFVVPSALSEKYPHIYDNLPSSTVAIEAGTLKKWNATLQKRYYIFACDVVYLLAVLSNVSPLSGL